MNELERVTENLRSNEYCTYAQMNEAANMLEAMRDRIAELEKDCCQLIDERDERDEVIDALMAQVLGRDCKEWSSAYGFNDAVVDVECRMKELEKDTARYQLRLETIRALYPSAPSDTELDTAIDAAMQKD